MIQVESFRFIIPVWILYSIKILIIHNLLGVRSTFSIVIDLERFSVKPVKC